MSARPRRSARFFFCGERRAVFFLRFGLGFLRRGVSAWVGEDFKFGSFSVGGFLVLGNAGFLAVLGVGGN